MVDLGWTGGTQYYDPTVTQSPDGSLAMSYVVMSNGVYVAHCPAGGQWDTLKRQISNSGYRPRIMRHSGGTYLYAYHKRTGTTYEYDVFITTSGNLDDWSEHMRMTDNMNSHDPFVCEMFDSAYMLSYAKNTAGVYNICCRFSYDAIDWGEEYIITEDNVNNTQPHLYIEGHDEYITYAHAVNYPDNHDVYLEELNYLTGIDEPVEIPGDYRLSLGSYPNPFNISTEISFNLGNAGQVKLEIYDILGSRVCTIVNSELRTGEHKYRWGDATIASGMYFARLQVDGVTEVVKMTLLK